jgi:hypothetical protein
MRRTTSAGGFVRVYLTCVSHNSILWLTCDLTISAGGFVRVYLTNGNLANAVAISSSLFMIVMVSVLAGTGLPFALGRVGETHN